MAISGSPKFKVITNNKWPQSEIDRNTAKQSLMAAQKQLIQLTKAAAGSKTNVDAADSGIS